MFIFSNYLGVVLVFLGTVALSPRASALKLNEPIATSSLIEQSKQVQKTDLWPHHDFTVEKTSILASLSLGRTNNTKLPQKDESIFPPSNATVRSRRQLLEGDWPRWLQQSSSDFDSINTLLQGSELLLPDTNFSQAVFSVQLEVSLQNILCHNIRLNAMTASYSQPNDQEIIFDLSLSSFDMDCRADYTYSYGFFGNGGTVVATSTSNSADIEATLMAATNFSESPPQNTTINACQSSLNIVDMTVTGGLVAVVANVFKRLVGEIVGSLAEQKACSEVKTLHVQLDHLLGNLTAKLDGFLVPIPTAFKDPLFPESNMTVPDTVSLLGFQSSNDSESGWFTQLLKHAETFFGTQVDNPTSPTGKDLSINVYLRDTFLDANRSLSINLTDLPHGIGLDPQLLNVDNRLVAAKLTVSSARLYGLDTLSAFHPLVTIGNYTLQNQLLWEYLTLELHVTADFQPSSRSDAVFFTAQPVHVVQDLVLSVQVNQVEAVLSVLLAIDQAKLQKLELGALLRPENILRCVLPVLFDAEIAGLEVSIAGLGHLGLSGFDSPGTQRLASALVDGLVVAYTPTILRAVPYLFQVSLRESINVGFIGPLLANSSAITCPSPENVEQYVDFRDLLLSPEQSQELGGSGLEPFGKLGSSVFAGLQRRLQNPDSDGRLLVNDLLRTATFRQSGENGTLSFPFDIFSINISTPQNEFLQSILNKLEMRAYDLRITELDSIVAPLSLLNPTTDAYVLNNLINVKSELTKPLSATLKLWVDLASTSSNKQPSEFEVGLSIGSIHILADIAARVYTNSMLKFPIGLLSNLDCWLATLADRSTSPFHGFNFESFLANFSSLAFDLSCIQCDNLGSAQLPEIVGLLKANGVWQILTLRLPPLIESVLVSDSFASRLDRRVLSARKLCPFSPDYTGNNGQAYAIEKAPLVIPPLSAVSLDTVLYAAVLAGWIAFVVIAKNQLLDTTDHSDPLQAQNAFETPNGVDLLDWTNLGNSTGLGPIVDTLLARANELVLGFDGDGNPSINRLIERVLGNNSTLTLNLDGSSFGRDGLLLNLTSLRIEGLNSFNSFSGIQAIGPQTLSTSFQLSSVKISAEIVADDITTPDPPQTISLQLSAENITATLALFVAIDVNKVRSLGLGSFLGITDVLSCLLSVAHSVQIPAVDFRVDSFVAPVVLGLLPETSLSATASIKAITDAYRSDIEQAIPLLLEGPVSEMISSLVERSAFDAKCNVAANRTDFLDFRQLFLSGTDAIKYGAKGGEPYGTIFHRFWDLLNNQLLVADPVTGSVPINDKLIAPLTKAQSGVQGKLEFSRDFINQGKNLTGGLDAYIELRVYDPYFENVDTIDQPSRFLAPVLEEAYLLNNSGLLGVSRPFRVGAKFMVVLTGEGTDIRNDVDVSVSIDTVALMANVLAKMKSGSFFGLPLKDITNVNCWLATMPQPTLDDRGMRVVGSDTPLSVLDFELSFVDISLNVSCIECNSPEFPELERLLSSPEGRKDASNLAFKLSETLTQIVGGSWFQTNLDRKVFDASRKCPNSPDYEVNSTGTQFESLESLSDESSMSFLLAIVAVAGFGFVFVVCLLRVIRIIVLRRHRNWLTTLSHKRLTLLLKQQKKDQEKEFELNKSGLSMFRSPHIPLFVRLFIPVVILGTVGLFLSGHLSPGGTVAIVGSFAGDTITRDNFYAFSVASSTIDIWKAGGKALAMMILIFSGIWPYTKQFWTLALWFLPPSSVSVSTRGSTLLWLDVLAKWSIIDVFVLFVSIVGFRFTAVSPSLAFLPKRFYSLDFLVIPKWGLYSNLTAQLVSQISSHFVIHYHRMIVVKETEAYEQRHHIQERSTDEEDSGHDEVVSATTNRPQHASDNDKEVLAKHPFARPHRGEPDKLVLRPWVNPIIVFCSFTLCVFVIVGCVTPTWSMEFLGILGIFVESGQEFKEAKIDYSVFSMVKTLMDQARFLGKLSDKIGLGSLSAVVIFSVLVVPITQTCVLVYIWFRPMSKRRRYRSSIFVEILAAWQYVEVYLLALLVGSWQLGPLSQNMVNRYCIRLNGLFAELAYFGIIEEKDAQCFQLDATIKGPFFVLVMAGLLLALLNTLIMKAVHHYFHDVNVMNDRRWDDAKDLPDTETFASETDEAEAIRAQILPVPVLFSDRFRWILHRQEAARPAEETADWTSVEPDGPGSVPDTPPRTFATQSVAPAGESVSAAITTDLLIDTGDLFHREDRPVANRP